MCLYHLSLYSSYFSQLCRLGIIFLFHYHGSILNRTEPKPVSHLSNMLLS